MSTADVVKILGLVVSCGVVINEFIKHIREWHKGSPELRLLRDCIEDQNKNLLQIVNNNTKLLAKVARKLGA